MSAKIKVSTVKGEIDTRPGTRPTLKTKILNEFDKIAERYPNDTLARGFAKDSKAEAAFIAWYIKERKNTVRTGERTGQRMVEHARWHLKTALLAREKETQGRAA